MLFYSSRECNKLSNMSSNKKILCKVCFDAGKSPEVYSSHYVKSADRKRIICPTILSIKCRYCEKEGHTVKYCDALKKRDLKQTQNLEKEKETEKEKEKEKKKEKKIDTTIKNKFSMLFDDEEEDEEEKEKEEEEKEKLPSYADILNKVNHLPIPKLVRSTNYVPPPPKGGAKRWCDYSDSESDNDSDSDIEQDAEF